MSEIHSDSLIRINKISHTYPNGTQALNGIDLEIGTGLFGLLGANGAGKSTLMKIICTLVEPSSGNINVAGYDVVKQRDDVRKIFGYLPQEFGAWKNKTIFSVLDILATLSGLRDKNKRHQRITEVLKSVGLDSVSEKKIKQLSGGMLRRVGIAQALVHDPKVLVMDEPTVGLDPEERLRLRQLMADLSKDRAIIFSTHIIADLDSSCSKLALIHQGSLEFFGTPEALISSAKERVYEIPVSDEMLQQLENNDDFEIVSRSFHGGQNVVRGVASEDFTFDGSELATNITLEEAHLAFTFGKGRTANNKEFH